MEEDRMEGKFSGSLIEISSSHTAPVDMLFRIVNADSSSITIHLIQFSHWDEYSIGFNSFSHLTRS